MKTHNILEGWMDRLFQVVEDSLFHGGYIFYAQHSACSKGMQHSACSKGMHYGRSKQNNVSFMNE